MRCCGSRSRKGWRLAPVVAAPGVLVDVLRRGAWDGQERLAEAVTHLAALGAEINREQRQEHRAQSDSLWELIDVLDQHSTGRGGDLSVDLERHGQALAIAMGRVQEEPTMRSADRATPGR